MRNERWRLTKLSLQAIHCEAATVQLAPELRARLEDCAQPTVQCLGSTSAQLRPQTSLDPELSLHVPFPLSRLYPTPASAAGSSSFAATLPVMFSKDAQGCLPLLSRPGHSAALPALGDGVVEARERRLRLVEVLLHLLAAVEDGAVAAGAQHVLVPREDLGLLGRAVAAQRRAARAGRPVHRRLAREAAQPHLRRCRLRDAMNTQLVNKELVADALANNSM
eukprot:361647-Chlamydomonas_euryale.AAC.4